MAIDQLRKLAVSGDVIGEAICCRDNTAVGNGRHCFPIGIIGNHVPRVARKWRTVPDLLPVDREARVT